MPTARTPYRILRLSRNHCPSFPSRYRIRTLVSLLADEVKSVAARRVVAVAARGVGFFPAQAFAAIAASASVSGPVTHHAGTVAGAHHGSGAVAAHHAVAAATTVVLIVSHHALALGLGLYRDTGGDDGSRSQCGEKQRFEHVQLLSAHSAVRCAGHSLGLSKRFARTLRYLWQKAPPHPWWFKF